MNDEDAREELKADEPRELTIEQVLVHVALWIGVALLAGFCSTF